jgi:hypothetical protein
MSIQIETIVICDGCGANCGADDRHLTAKEIRDSRKARGWTQVGRRDYCDVCSAKRRIENSTRNRVGER